MSFNVLQSESHLVITHHGISYPDSLGGKGEKHAGISLGCYGVKIQHDFCRFHSPIVNVCVCVLHSETAERWAVGVEWTLPL